MQFTVQFGILLQMEIKNDGKQHKHFEKGQHGKLCFPQQLDTEYYAQFSESLQYVQSSPRASYRLDIAPWECFPHSYCNGSNLQLALHIIDKMKREAAKDWDESFNFSVPAIWHSYGRLKSLLFVLDIFVSFLTVLDIKIYFWSKKNLSRLIWDPWIPTNSRHHNYANTD